MSMGGRRGRGERCAAHARHTRAARIVRHLIPPEPDERLLLGYEAAKGLAAGHARLQKGPIALRLDVSAEEVHSAAAGCELARGSHHRLEVEERLLEQHRLPRAQRTLNHPLDKQDRLPVQVLGVQQVLAGPLLRVVLAYQTGELVLPPRREVPAPGGWPTTDRGQWPATWPRVRRSARGLRPCAGLPVA